VVLAAQGARLALAARDAARLEEWRANAAPAVARSCRATDIANEVDCGWLIETTLQTFGGIDVLIHNAGITMWSRFDAVSDFEIFERLMQVNYLAPVRLTALALPPLKQSKGDRRGGEHRRPDRRARTLGLRASKHAMIGFFDSLRIELRGTAWR